MASAPDPLDCSRGRPRGSPLLIVWLLTSFSSVGHAAPDPATGAIDAGIEFLLPATQNHLNKLDGYRDDNAVGQLALQVYALLVAGVSLEHPTVRASFAYFSKVPLEHVYTISCYAFALDAAIAQLEGDLALTLSAGARARLRKRGTVGKVIRTRLAEVVNAVASGQNETGGWRYKVNSTDVDNSNTQFAVLALGIGARRGIAIPQAVWLEILEYFVENQEADGDPTAKRIELRRPRNDQPSKVSTGKRKARTGVKAEPADSATARGAAGPETARVLKRGWDYENDGNANWNMTCAGLSSLLIAQDQIGRLPPMLREDLFEAIRDGYGWLMENWNFEHNYYGMYSLEKVADLGRVQRFGTHDWYKEVSEHLIREQTPEGSWAPNGGGWKNAEVATSLALLILNRATSLLISSPAERIILSGHGVSRSGDDRDWVYIPKLDTRVHYPSVLRNLRMRPSLKLVRFVKDLVEHYPPEWVGELVPSLLDARERLTTLRLRKPLERYLADITGVRLYKREVLTAWHVRWKRALEIGKTRNPAAAEELLTAYRIEKTVPLKKLQIWALGQLKAKAALPLYLTDLEHKSAEVRATAYSAFRGFFLSTTPPFDSGAPAKVRAAQITALRRWYKTRSRG